MLFVGGNRPATRRSDRSAAEERNRHRRTAADAPSRSQRTARRRSRALLAQNFDHQHPGAVDDRDEARDIACSDPKKPGSRPAKSSAPPTTKANPKPTLM